MKTPTDLAAGDRVKIRAATSRTAQRFGTVISVGPVSVVCRDDKGFTQTIRREHAARRLQKIESVKPEVA